MSKNMSDLIHEKRLENVSRLGFWSAILAAVFGTSYIIAELVSQLGLLGLHDGPLSLIFRMAPSLLLAPTFVVLMVSIHYYASEENKIWSHVGMSFAIVYMVLVSIVYFVELVVVVPHLQRGEADKVALLIFEWGSFMFAVDIIGYSFMNLATLFAAPVFSGKRLERWIHWILIANGLQAPTNAGMILIPFLWNIAALWVITFPLSTVLLAVLFRQRKP